MSVAGRSQPIRVLIIDDSATMRGLMAHALSKDPGIEVVGYAGDAYGAREAIKKLDPDVVTLDIEMPRMDGLTFLAKLMRLRPLPVVVVTSKTDQAEDIEFSALRLGAAHCLFKPAGMSGATLFEALPGKVREAYECGPGVQPGAVAQSSSQAFDGAKIICLGASTGGVDALVSVLRHFPKDCPPTLIVQHMPDKFIPLFAQRLNSVCAPSVHIARGGSPVAPGRILISPAGIHLRLSRKNPDICMLDDRPPVNGFKPSVDVLFQSAADSVGAGVVAGLLTGMGRDGAKGLLAVRNAGGHTVAQDEKTSVVWGMPRIALEMGAVDQPLPLDNIAEALLAPCRAKANAREAS